MSLRTRQLAEIDRWQNLRGRLLAGWGAASLTILGMLLAAKLDEDNWWHLPLFLVLAALGGLVVAAGMLLLGLTLRWQTLPGRLTAPACAALLLVGAAGAGYCILATSGAPRSPADGAEPRHAAVYLASLAAVAFAAANWPARRKR